MGKFRPGAEFWPGTDSVVDKLFVECFNGVFVLVSYNCVSVIKALICHCGMYNVAFHNTRGSCFFKFAHFLVAPMSYTCSNPLNINCVLLTHLVLCDIV